MEKKIVAVTIIAAILVAAALVFLNPSAPAQEKKVLKIYSATSLLYPLGIAEGRFEALYPDVDVQIEGHGSIQVIRHVVELGDTADLLMVADYSLIPTMMYVAKIPESTQSYSSWYLRFSENSIVLAYTNTSKYASEITADNWYNILSRPDVKYGFPNPMIDALGYRCLITMQLAESYYGDASIFDRLVSLNFNPPILTTTVGEKVNITVPEILNPEPKVYLRSSSIHLIPLLETGTIDYCFLYLSNAEQQNFSYMLLPDEINLASPEMAEHYSSVSVNYKHERFATISLNRTGAPIYYGLTIPANAKNPDLAAEFVKFIIYGEGKNIFNEAHQSIIFPAYTDNHSGLPATLKPYAEEEP